MYIRLSDGVKLRGYMFVPQCFYYRYDKTARKLTEEELGILKCCDGETDVLDSELLQTLISRRIVTPCNKGDKIKPWQAYRYHKNRYFPSAKIAITGKCCFNCRHCFNSASLAIETTEFSRDELLKLIADLDECGVHSLQITGGEPLLHPALKEALQEIAKRGMHLFEFITTGHFLTPELVELFVELGLRPQFKLSYDGIGHHDWFRKMDGAEKKLIEQIKLLKSHNFNVRVHMQAYHGNKDVWLKTALFCDKMGVDEIQLIRTYETPRTEGSDICDKVLSPDEFYDYGLELLDEYIVAGGNNDINLWQFIHVMPRAKRYILATVHQDVAKYRDSIPICGKARGMLQIDYDGEVWPCLPLSGWCKARGIHYGNVKKQPIGQLLTFSDFMDTLDITIGERREHNPCCKACKYFKLCSGGCPALGMFTSGGDYLANDKMKCLFWNKYFRKTVEMFERLGFTSVYDLSKLD